MRKYETVFVLDPSLEEQGIEKEITKVEDFIGAQGGKVLEVQRWGMRRLAYPIAKKKQGYYTLILFEGDLKLPQELEKSYRLNELCLRYLTVLAVEKPSEPLIPEKKETETESLAGQGNEKKNL